MDPLQQGERCTCDVEAQIYIGFLTCMGLPEDWGPFCPPIDHGTLETKGSEKDPPPNFGNTSIERD